MTATPDFIPTPEVFTCICGQFVRKPEDQHDFKCQNCGRVYNYRLQYLWKEDTLNELPGTGTFVEGPEAHGERRNEDQDAALEEAFVEGKLPPEDRRGTDEVETPKKKRR
jgi:hypothetical protein